MTNKADFVDVVYSTKDNLFCAVRRRALVCGNKIHIDDCYRSLLLTIKEDIPDNAINCSFSINSEWTENDDSFFYELCYEIPKEQAYYPKYQGKISKVYESVNRELWDDLEDLQYGYVGN